MQFSSVFAFGLAAFAASVSASSNCTVSSNSTVPSSSSSSTVAYVTETVTAYTTVCPFATELTHGGVTYTATASQTLTITNCPCTIVKPVVTSSVVICSTCTASVAPPAYTNGTGPIVTSATSIGSYVTVRPTAPPATTTPIVEANSGNKAFALSGASLAGLLGFAAYFL